VEGRPQVRSIHIEGCDQIASAELGIEAIIANCPLLESFTCVVPRLVCVLHSCSHTAPIPSLEHQQPTAS
jgi:hypothetical protein